MKAKPTDQITIEKMTIKLTMAQATRMRLLRFVSNMSYILSF